MISVLIDIVKDKFVDFNKVKEESIFLKFSESLYDISIIIPVRGRHKFLKPLLYYFDKAKKNSELKINYIVVEHSEIPEHSKFCKTNKVDYFWIKSESAEMFNKCLAMNIGAIFSPKSNYFIFHDLDCIVQSDFFNNLMSNVEKKSCKAIQTFHGRRVLYLNDDLTQKSIDLSLDLDSLNEKSIGVSLPMYIGAPGGSIMIENNLFFEVGGYDNELFLGNSPEDIFFWDKVETITKMEVANNPKIEIFHMNHPPTYYSNPKINEMKSYHEIFKNSTNDEKLLFIKEKRKNLINFYE